MTDPSPVTMDEDIELFKTRLTNGKLPDEELISFYYIHLPTESEVNKYNALLGHLHSSLQEMSKNTVSNRLRKYVLGRWHNGNSVTESQLRI